MDDAADGKWRRLSVTDVLIAVSCFAVGFAISHHIADQTLAVLGGLLIGLWLSGPAVFMHQWLCRGRRSELSGGEVIWLLTGALFLANVGLFAANYAFPSTTEIIWIVLASADCFALGAIPVAAFILLLQVILGVRDARRRSWSDTIGCIVGGISISSVIYLIAIHASED